MVDNVNKRLEVFILVFVHLTISVINVKHPYSVRFFFSKVRYLKLSFLLLATHPCVTMPEAVCVNGGTCIINGADFLCNCPTGWTGTNCETPDYML